MYFYSILILVSLVTLHLPANALTQQSTRLESIATTPCTPYKFIGMRGSGQEFGERSKERTKESREMGPEMASLYGHLQNLQEFKGKMSFNGVPDYPAVSVPQPYQNFSKYVYSLKSVATLELRIAFGLELSRCPDTKFIIAGYSQGAYGAHYLIKFIEDNKSYIRNSIIGAIFLANPSENRNGILTKPNLVSLARGVTKKEVKELFLPKIKEGFMKTLSHFEPDDVIADTDDVSWNVTVPATAAQNILKFKRGERIHTSYCSPSGKFAPAEESKRSRCNAEFNRNFLQTSENYIRGQLTELKRLDNERRQNVSSWYGWGWQVPTNCKQIINQGFSKLTKELSKEFKDYYVSRLRILATYSKNSFILFVNEEDLELISYTPEDGLYSLETPERIDEYFKGFRTLNDVFGYLSKQGLISNLILKAESDWSCEANFAMDS